MPTGRATPPMLKDLNERTVLDAIRSYAPISRAEISRRVGISKPTVSLALQSLLDAGLVREGRPTATARATAPSSSSRCRRRRSCSALDLGARFVRGAVCDLQRRRSARARTSSWPSGRPPRRSRRSTSLSDRCSRRRMPGRARRRRRRSACRAQSTARRAASPSRRTSPASRARRSPPTLGARLGTPCGSRTTSTSRRSASSGAASHAASTTSRSSRSAPVSAPGSSCAASSTVDSNGAAGELDYARAGLAEDIDPCADALLRADAPTCRGRRPCSSAVRHPLDVRRRPRRRSPSPSRWSPRRRAGSRSTSRRSRPSPTSASSCSAAGSARTADLLYDGIRSLLADVAADTAARRGLEPRRRRRAHGRARGRAPRRARERLRESPRLGVVQATLVYGDAATAYNQQFRSRNRFFERSGLCELTNRRRSRLPLTL